MREVSNGPVATLFAGERREPEVSRVAVKVLRHPRTRDDHLLATLRDHGRRLALLDHPGIVAATEIAWVDGRPALVRPWVDGIVLLD